MQCYLQPGLRPVLLKSDRPQTGSWSSPGCVSAGNPGAAAPAAGETAPWEVLSVLGFEAEKPSSPQKSKSRGGGSPNTETTS